MVTKSRRTTKTGKEVTQILQVVSQMTPETLQQDVEDFAKRMTALGSGMGGACTTLLSKVHVLNDAITLKEDRLQELYDIEKACLTQASVEQTHAEERDAFAREIATTKQAWEDEAARHEAEVKRRDEEAEYAHQQRLARFEQEFKATCEENRRREAIRQQDLERQWSQRTVRTLRAVPRDGRAIRYALIRSRRVCCGGSPYGGRTGAPARADQHPLAMREPGQPGQRTARSCSTNNHGPARAHRYAARATGQSA